MKLNFVNLISLLLPLGLVGCGVAGNTEVATPQKNQVVTLLPQRESSGTLPRKALFLSITVGGKQLHSSEQFELVVHEGFEGKRDLLVLNDCAADCRVDFDLERAGLYVFRSGGKERQATGYRFVSEDSSTMRVAVDFL